MLVIDPLVDWICSSFRCLGNWVTGGAYGITCWNKKVPPRFELGSQDSKSWVLTVTPRSRPQEAPWNLTINKHGVTWGQSAPFGDDLSLTYLFASTSEKNVTNYMLCVYDRISHAQWQHVSRKWTFNSRSQNLSCGAKCPGAYDPT